MHHLRSLKEIHCIAKGPGISKSDANIRILLLLATGLYRGSQKITDISQHKHLQYIVGKSLKPGNFGKFGVGTFTPSCLSPHLDSWRLKHPVEDIWVTSRILLIVTMNPKLQPHIREWKPQGATVLTVAELKSHQTSYLKTFTIQTCLVFSTSRASMKPFPQSETVELAATVGGWFLKSAIGVPEYQSPLVHRYDEGKSTASKTNKFHHPSDPYTTWPH